MGRKGSPKPSIISLTDYHFKWYTSGVSLEASRLILTLGLIGLIGVWIGLGIYLIKFIKDLRPTITKVNRVLENVGEISENVAKPAAAVGGIMSGLKEGASIIKRILK
jgi:hypothetical protein